MKIYINGRFLTQSMTGVHRYAYEMCKALISIGAEITIVCPQRPILSMYDISGWNIVRYGFGNSHLWEQLVLPLFFIGKKNYLLLSFTGLGSVLVRNKISTIHDLAFLENPSWYSRAYYLFYKFMTPLVAKTSRCIITVSNSSRDELLRFYPFLRNKHIEVAYNACDRQFFSNGGQLPSNVGCERYYLAVQSLDPRKNLSVLLKAFSRIDNAKLYLVGGSNAVFARLSEMSELNNSDSVVYLGRVPDAELVALYSHAEGFISSSLFEGFGIPLIEAMSLDCPVFCSDIPVYHEVCGNAAIFFNPTSVDELSEAIGRVESMSREEKDLLVEEGRKRTTLFSWKKSAEKVLNLCNSLK